MMSAEALAALAIETLNAQKEYFKTRDHAKLIASKELEVALRRESDAIISAQERLFE